MRATGIVRRIDDLGRVAIPKEIRRNMRIKEGDPLEIFTTREGEVVFKKYEAYDEKDWDKAKRMVQTLTDVPFALYDSWGDIKARTNASFTSTFEAQDGAIYSNGDIVGFIQFGGLSPAFDEKTIKKMLSEFLSIEN